MRYGFVVVADLSGSRVGHLCEDVSDARQVQRLVGSQESFLGSPALGLSYMPELYLDRLLAVTRATGGYVDASNLLECAFNAGLNGKGQPYPFNANEQSLYQAIVALEQAHSVHGHSLDDLLNAANALGLQHP